MVCSSSGDAASLETSSSPGLSAETLAIKIIANTESIYLLNLSIIYPQKFGLLQYSVLNNDKKQQFCIFLYLKK